MSYVVYVNYPTNKARVHFSECRRYKNRKNDTTINGYWSEIFETYDDALNFATNTKKINIDSCAFCIKPGKNI